MKPDVRYYAVTQNGRYKITADDEDEAKLMARGFFEPVVRFIKETREELPL